MINSLLYERGLFPRAHILPARFNALARTVFRKQEWFNTGGVRGPALIHFSSETKPWRIRPHASGRIPPEMRALLTRWRDACGDFLPDGFRGALVSPSKRKGKGAWTFTPRRSPRLGPCSALACT